MTAFDLPIRRDGPPKAPGTVVLAHGAGADMDHAFLTAVANGFAAAGLAVVRFNFPYRARGGRLPDRLPVLQQALREIVQKHATGPLVLAGKSMGGRVATTLADELAARATVVFGYPFHPPKQPLRLRTEHLATLRTPLRILQGERDPFGTRSDVAGYALSPAIEVQWFADGDHDLVPRRASGCTAAGHLATAIQSAVEFAQRHLG